jgi:ADP-ribosyl-[dinitrogen reductase] hydrolase
MSSTDQTLISRAKAAYLGLAIGDALGATVEFMTPQEISHTYGIHDSVIGGGWLRLPPGQVTDDTTMSLYLGKALLDTGSADPLKIAEAFDAWMRSKPVDIGNTVRRGILRFRHQGQAIGPEREQDAGNGACMRTLPIALFTYAKSPDEIAKANKAQAHVTHHNPLSDAACECIINMVHLSLDGNDKNKLRDGPVEKLVSQYPIFNYENGRCINPTGYIVDTMKVVLQAFFNTDTFKSCLIDVVNRGGDADTTGAIAGMIAGAYYGEEQIPTSWSKALIKDVHQSVVQQAEDLISVGAIGKSR